MVEGKIEIFLSYREPEFKDNILWLRPYLDKEGYELLYYGANGWTRFIPCHPESPTPNPSQSETTESQEVPDTPLTEIKPNTIGDIQGAIYEITPSIIPPSKKTTCGCPN